jgi:hypothetical protein
MSTISWITNPGVLDNILIGIPANLQITAIDSAHSGTIHYTLISGSLPTGLTLGSDGSITGTPTYSSPSNNYFKSADYKFIVRARANNGTVVDGAFTIIITNTVNGDFAWATPAGSLGTVPNGEFYSFRLLAQSTNNDTITYSLVSGELPTGLQIIQSDISFDETVVLQQAVSSGSILTLPNVVGIPIGAIVTGTNIPANTIVSDVNLITKTVTLSNTISGTIRINTPIRFYKVTFYAGTLAGVPTFLNPLAVDQNQTYKFTIRARTTLNHIIDRSFNLTVTNVYGPVIEPYSPDSYFLGTFFDGSYFSQQLNVVELNPAVNLQWKIVDGDIPAGLSIGTDGKLSGYIHPLELVGSYGPAYYDGAVEVNSIVTDKQSYNQGPYDFNQLNQSLTYGFTVQVYDGANYDLQKYYIQVISRSGWTADNDYEHGINNTYLTIDSINNYIPVLLNAAGTLPTARQNSYYAYKFNGYDFDGDSLTYELANVVDTFDSGPFDPLERNDANNGLSGSFDAFDAETAGQNNLPGVTLDSNTGWLYGLLDPQATALENYSVGVVVSKIKNTIKYQSVPVYFTLPVLGDVNNVIYWVTPSNLGSVDNGAVCELSVSAVSVAGKSLVYSLVDEANLPVNLPQGLSLLPSGDISGRVSFEVFSVDELDTTFDGSTTTIDRTYTFTVKAEASDGTSSSIQQFNLSLNVIATKPYENLYLVAMPKHDQRLIYNSIVSDTDIFDPAIIYRPTDPWFGVRKNIEMLFLSGLNTKTLDSYQQAIVYNHWTKRYSFDGINTASVLDENYNIKYEVVYVTIVDPAENSSNKGAALSINLSNTIANPYIDSDGNEYKTVYPNSSENMVTRLEQAIGYQDQSSLPPWMTSNQPDSTTASKFKIPLGYTKAAVLAYTKPGASKLIAYRLKNAGLNFNEIEFSVDRYQVDNYYSQNFNPTTGKYNLGTETTFDYLPTNNIGNIVSYVNYAVTVPFSEINGKPLSYILNNGGLDGEEFIDGATLIFYKQEGFVNVDLYDGWVYYTDSWIGDNITTSAIEGYDSGSYDTYSLVPGYLEKAQQTAQTNQRAGVWTVNIANGIVFLTSTFEVNINDRVQILNGKTLKSAILYYDPILVAGQTVPTYKVYNFSGASISDQTTFNNGTTRFVSNRDQYYKPGTQDKYLKFPQTGVFK